MAEYRTLVVAKTPDAAARAAQWARGELTDIDVSDAPPTSEAMTDVVVEGSFDDPKWMLDALTIARSVAATAGQISILVSPAALSTLGHADLVEPLEGWAVRGLSVIGADVLVHLEPISTPEKAGITRDSLEGAAMLADMLVTLADRSGFDRDDFEYRTAHVIAQFRALPRLKRELAAAAPPGPVPASTVTPAATTSTVDRKPGHEGVASRGRRRRLVTLMVGACVAWTLLSLGVSALLDAGADGFLVLLALGGVVGVGVDGRRRAVRAHADMANMGHLVGDQGAKRRAEVQQVLAAARSQSREIAAVSASTRVGVVLAESTAAVLSEVQATIESLNSGLESRLAVSTRAIGTDLRREAGTLYAQIEAMVHLRDVVTVTGPTPPLRGWAASPDVLKLLIDELVMRRPSSIVECGSGASTVWLAMAVRTLGLPTRIVALEHEGTFGTTTRRWLDVCGVADIAEVRDAPLVQLTLDHFDGLWYAPTAIDGLRDIGLVFVDGPPADTGRGARYPALPMLYPCLAPDVTVILDDLIRQDERDVLQRWETEFTGFRVERVALEKGAAVLRRRQADP